MNVIVSPYAQKQRAIGRQMEDVFKEGYRKGFGEGQESGMNFMLDYIKKEMVEKHGKELIENIEQLIRQELEAAVASYKEKTNG